MKNRGHSFNPEVPNRLLKSSGDTEHLAVFFPGSDYSTDGPCFYYLANLFLDHGVDCLLIDRVWAREERWLASGKEDREKMAREEAESILPQVLAMPYARISLAAKSLGTRAMAPFIANHAVSMEFQQRIAQIIWLTPSLGTSEQKLWPVLKTPLRHYAVIGTTDPLYAHFKPYAADVPHSAIADGDHGLDVGGVEPSIAALSQVMKDLGAWLEF